MAEFIADEVRQLEPRGAVVTIPNGSDFDDFEGLAYTPGDRLRITHTGSFFGKRDPRPFLQALHDSGVDAVARFLGDFRSADREWAEALGLGDRLELIPYAPRSTSLALQRDSEALLLLIPEAGGRGRGVLSGKVFEYLAAAAPDPRGGASRRRGRRPHPRDRSGRRRGSRRRRRASARRSSSSTARFRNGGLAGRRSVARTGGAGSRARPGSRRLAELLRSLA